MWRTSWREECIAAWSAENKSLTHLAEQIAFNVVMIF